jgi:hypothetical protein
MTGKLPYEHIGSILGCTPIAVQKHITRLRTKVTAQDGNTTTGSNSSMSGSGSDVNGNGAAKSKPGRKKGTSNAANGVGKKQATSNKTNNTETGAGAKEKRRFENVIDLDEEEHEENRHTPARKKVKSESKFRPEPFDADDNGSEANPAKDQEIEYDSEELVTCAGKLFLSFILAFHSPSFFSSRETVGA